MEAWTARESPTAEQQASPVSSGSGSPGGADGLRARLRASRSEVYCILQVGPPAGIIVLWLLPFVDWRYSSVAACCACGGSGSVR